MDTLEAWDLAPGCAVEVLRVGPQTHPSAVMAAAGPNDVPVLLRPFVWLLALLVLPLRAAGRAGERFLEAYEHGADAAGRTVLRAGRALGRGVLRVLGPFGRLLRRVLAPAWHLVVRLWDRAGLWLTLRLLRPLHRVLRLVLDRCRPVVERVFAWGRAVVARLEPVTAALTRAVLAVERATDRLGARLRRAWAPVSRALAVLTPRRDRSAQHRGD